MPKNLFLKINRPSAKEVFKKIRGVVIKALSKSAQQHIVLRDKATEGWSDTNKPKVTIEPIDGAGFFGYRVKVEASVARGSTEGLTVYQLLDGGTIVRRALFDKNFAAKTMPNKLGKFGEGGEPIDVDRRFNLPGIERRNFEQTIRGIIESDAEVIINGAFKDAFNG